MFTVRLNEEADLVQPCLVADSSWGSRTAIIVDFCDVVLNCHDIPKPMGVLLWIVEDILHDRVWTRKVGDVVSHGGVVFLFGVEMSVFPF